MKAVILIVENRTAYRERLMAGLQQSGDYEVVAAANIREVNKLDEDKFNRVALILTSEFFSDPLASIFPGTLRLEFTDKPQDDSAKKLHLYVPEIVRQGQFYLSRHSSITYIREIIASILIQPLAARKEEKAEFSAQISDQSESETFTTQADHSLGSLLFFSRDERIKASTTILRSGKKKAHDMIYLPLMPLYDMAFSFRSGGSQTLGDLLLMLKSGRAPEHEDLGSYLYLHNDGYYTFTCPNRADDLICADKRSLRELIVLLRKYLETRAAPTHSLIEISGLTLEKHAMIAALCDYVVIETPTKTTSAALIAQQELALFLSKLPGSCEIYESQHVATLHEEAPWFY
ncbi:MAG: hypothetical protein PHR78_00410 [Eubacteriales bacterium]|nr:hypothetical protein [Eubacteriales bacterium]MDD4324021.1 hypothetical protein [Eubacteriales bacterium]MDD4540617.1 hypothetical protein [Eubacteriales bacterium]